MDNIPVLESKLIMPELTGSFLLTERLSRLHMRMDNFRAISVCAPAGYGKTTLSVSFFNRQSAAPYRVCWYRIDPEDKNLPVFLAHLIETIFPSNLPEFQKYRKTIEVLHNSQESLKNAMLLLCRAIWNLHSQAGQMRTFIVLDDFHNVAQAQEICDMTSYMLNNLPPSFSVFILSRTAHSNFTEKQKLDNSVLEITAEDLTFSSTEIEGLMRIMGDGYADSKLTRVIEKNTEGWIAGIIILYQAFKSMDPISISIENGGLCHEDALFRYMSLEVLKSINEATVDAIARLALLQEFSEAEASHILEIEDTKSLMGKCMGFGMFIQRIPGNPVVYRFHSLFREFLLYILKSLYTEEQIARLHLKAAGYYLEHGAYGRAAEHLTNCGNSDLAMDLVTRAGFNKFMIGETGQLKKWLDMLPEEMIMDNPVLLLFKVQLMPNSRQPEMVDTLYKILRLSLEKKNYVIYYDAASVLIYILMCSNNMKGLLEMTANNPHETPGGSQELHNSLAMLDMVRSMAEEKYTIAEAQSESIVFTRLPEDSKWLYLILSCINYFCLGKLDHAEHCMKIALELESFKNIEPSKGFILLFYSIVSTLKNERQQLPLHIKEIVAIGEKYDYEYLTAHGKRLAAYEHYLSHDSETASAVLQQSAFHFLHINNKAMAAACRLLKCLWSLRNSIPIPHLEELLEDTSLIQAASPGLMVHEISVSIAGAIARESGDLIRSEQCLLSAISSSNAKKGYQVLCGSYFHIARLYFAWDNMEQGKFYLKQAVELAAVNRYFMFWDIHIPTIVDMTLRSIRYGYCTEYAKELLCRFCEINTAKYLIEKVRIMEEDRITAFIDNFIYTFNGAAEGQHYLVNVTLFGRSEISVNGTVIPDAEWKTKKVKSFLEYLLLNSGNTISKEQLTEVLWPESDSRSGIASQRTALYHLRKTLAKYGAEVAGDNAFVYEIPEGLQIRRNDFLELDMHEFLRLNGSLSLHDDINTQMEDKQVKLLERMLFLYKGDLMENSEYGDMVINERERLKSIFMGACCKLSAIYIKREELLKAEETLRRAAAAEPYSENICLEQLRLYMLQGRKSKAVKLYYSFKNRLEQELGISIDSRLTEAIRN